MVSGLQRIKNISPNDYCSGSVVECSTRDPEVHGSSLTEGTV